MWQTLAVLVFGIVIGVVVARADFPSPDRIKPKVVATEAICVPSTSSMAERFDQVFGPEYPFVAKVLEEAR
jgi:hypothetical protein